MMADQSFTFQLSPDEHKRQRKTAAAAAGVLRPWMYAIIGVSYAVESVSLIVLHRWIFAGFFFLLALTWLIFFVRTNRKKLPFEGRLQLSAAGLSGTLDRKPATIEWSDLATVHDIDDSIVLVRRKAQEPIAIPKSAISDVAAFWALLDDRLVSKRGLIRPAGPQRQILNTAC